jgi:hypothetical protein
MFISFLYMFWVTVRPTSGAVTVSIWHLVLVTLKQMDSLKPEGLMSQN